MARPFDFKGLGEAVGSSKGIRALAISSPLIFLLIMAIGGGAFAAPPSFSITGSWGGDNPRNFLKAINTSDSISHSPILQVQGASSLIVHRREQMEAARLLQDFHSRKLGISSELVSVESISRSESPIPEAELPSGYKDSTSVRSVISDQYDFMLARKLIHFFRTRLGSVRYITLLGLSDAIPPSYYVAVPTEFSERVQPTDLCYTADEQCRSPRAILGRLPFSSTQEMSDYLVKAERFLETAFPQELTLMGGKGFSDTRLFVGELAALSALEAERVDWSGVQKKFLTDGSYRKSALVETFSGKSASPYLYWVDHGRGNELFIEAEVLTTNEAQALWSEGERNPIVLTPACAGAAYDVPLSKEPVLGLLSKGTTSVAVGLLRARAGAVAYVGAPRLAYGNPITEIDEFGTLTQKGNSYFLKLLDFAVQNIREGKGRRRLGDILLPALQQYAATAEKTDPVAYWSLSGLTLMGDPLLFLPARPLGERASDIARSETLFDGVFEKYPFWNLAGSWLGDFRVYARETANATLYRVDSTIVGQTQVTKLHSQRLYFGQTRLSFPDLAAGSYLNRIENEFGVPRERQVWFDVK